MRPYLIQLYDHLRWADLQTLASIRTAPSDRALTLYAHILGSEHTWISRLLGTPSTVAIWPTLTLDECSALAEENHRQLTEFVNASDDAELARVVHYVNSAGTAFQSTVSDILLHVALHGSYHRGQIATAVRQGGGTPASTDFIAFTRGAPAPTRQ
jgi:uncharacterized damage-inducible protein DinB